MIVISDQHYEKTITKEIREVHMEGGREKRHGREI
jgi:hypothetical protein